LTVDSGYGASALARLFRALGDETRVRIVALLAHGELCPCHIEASLDLRQPNVSRHLGVLRVAGIVDTRRDGSWMYYSLAPQPHAAATAMLDDLVARSRADAAIRAEHARVKQACGPDAAE
jgi:ArsR family transcriptional regulator